MDLKLSVAISPQALNIDYALQNSRPDAVYVHQYLPERFGPPVRSGHVYAHGDGQLLLYFGTVPNPPRVCIMQEVRLVAELLPAFGTVRRSISLPLPIIECGKMTDSNATAPHQTISLSRLRLVLCYTAKQPRMEVKDVFPESGLYDVLYARATEIEASVDLPHAIEALRRTDAFDRPFEPTSPP